jgi:hypothetical protein
MLFHSHETREELNAIETIGQAINRPQNSAKIGRSDMTHVSFPRNCWLPPVSGHPTEIDGQP